jgi:hypothetical protein
MTGCGNETEKANGLVDEVNSITQGVEGKRSQADDALAKAFGQMGAGNIDEEKTNLTKAQSLINEIIPEVEKARGKTTEAASLKISDNYRKYLEAKTRSLDAAIKLNQLDRDMITLLLADPAMEKPETNTRIAEMQKTITDLTTQLNAAEAEADSIASENSDEIGG